MIHNNIFEIYHYILHYKFLAYTCMRKLKPYTMSYSLIWLVSYYDLATFSLNTAHYSQIIPGYKRYQSISGCIHPVKLQVRSGDRQSKIRIYFLTRDMQLIIHIDRTYITYFINFIIENTRHFVLPEPNNILIYYI